MNKMRLLFVVGAALAIMAFAPSLQARCNFQLNLAGFFNIGPRCHHVVHPVPVPVVCVPRCAPQPIIIHRPVYAPVYVYDPACCQPVYTPRHYECRGTFPPVERVCY